MNVFNSYLNQLAKDFGGFTGIPKSQTITLKKNTNFMKLNIRVVILIGLGFGHYAQAALLTNPNDPRVWQGASVGTFAQLFFGSDTFANRQAVVNAGLMDDGHFNASGFVQGTLVKYNNVDVIANPGFGSYGTSLDQPNVVNPGHDGTYNYSYSGVGAAFGGNAVDQHWTQTDNGVGHSIWDLGFQASKAAIFNTVDHGPLPGEAIESTVYLSNDKVNWTQAVTERVWMEGIYSDTSVIWDGFAYVVGTGTANTFRYASIIWGGPGALLSDGDNEINGVMGLQGDFSGTPVPEPSTYLAGALLLIPAGLQGFRALRNRRQSS